MNSLMLFGNQLADYVKLRWEISATFIDNFAYSLFFEYAFGSNFFFTFFFNHHA